ncbi:MAG: cytochrome c [Anaerolineales bacterium]|nr:cytochrome c [Anaerolineales bacterium]
MQGKWIVLLIVCLLAACSSNDTPTETKIDPNSDAGRGQILFSTHCATCHAVKGDRIVVGPSLDGIATRASKRVLDLSAEDYIRESILYPDNYLVDSFQAGSMQQNFGSTLTSEDVNYLIAYLLTLK